MESDVQKKDNDQDWREIPEIYQLLRQGLGWSRVTKQNVDALITQAMADQNKKMEQELRNWR